ncbi:uncharacterized protein BO97DRAFT_27934 [Aspergillus homomorphus CBS 101889]|uniref:Alpha-1,6-mannosyltransferase subunit n=1 Tax=Aspergillus homomorphus (strain CBS 101889) TaxID=1450537 RepID=A0A395I0Y5_ASPHC|nr:hypothetical protein BO97DRAFT_27934 [Aspergillus homomorphus CBS 101889]RAL13851.1 hypothetical protein BO97DRAFT_27934 [Aspergillus homomorphus CBS 101889]
MGLGRIINSLFTYVSTRRLTVLALVILAWLLCSLHPSLDLYANQQALKEPREDEYKARFLYTSSFRRNPDLEYERRLANALQELERAVLERHKGNSVAEDRIWQIAKDASQRGPDSIYLQERNPGWAYTLVSDAEASKFVADKFSAIPEIAQVYESYPYHVLRADLLRYLLLYYYGGFYADMDIYPARPINECPALQSIPKPTVDDPMHSGNVSLVVGVELDEPYASPKTMRFWHWTRSYGLIQYTMYAPRRFSPLLREIIVRCLSHSRQYNQQHGGILGRFSYNKNAILGITGPDVLTDAILDALSSSLPASHPFVQKSVGVDQDIGDLISSEGKIQRRVTWAPFHDLSEPICADATESIPGTPMGGLCVVPISVWGNGQRHSKAEGFNSPHACLNHRFGGSWKKGWRERLFG